MSFNIPIMSREEALSTLDEKNVLDQLIGINKSIGWGTLTRNHSITRCFKDKTADCFLARKGNSILGYIFIEPGQYSEKSAYIPYLAISEKSQSQGIGSALMRAAVICSKDPQIKFDCREKVVNFYSHFAQKEGLEYKAEKDGTTYLNGDLRYWITYDLEISTQT